ncbi:MAG: putative metallopeptidase [Candidatus Pacearchaeota archaeon]|nr:putative metallopeptidase [Candidatus Pacearchaeota archaeon]
MIRYEEANDLRRKIEEIINVLELKHIKLERVFCFRSYGSNARGIIARCHSLPKILQEALKTEPAYVIEVIAEKFEKLSEEEKTKILIHELLHIPKSFKGGFVYHDHTIERKTKKLYQKFKELKNRREQKNLNSSNV